MLQVWKMFSPLTKVGIPERSYGTIDYLKDKRRIAQIGKLLLSRLE